MLADDDPQALEHGERLLAPVGREHGGAHGARSASVTRASGLVEAPARRRCRASTSANDGRGVERQAHRGGTGIRGVGGWQPQRVEVAGLVAQHPAHPDVAREHEVAHGLDERPLALDPLVEQRLGQRGGVGQRVVPLLADDRPGPAHLLDGAHLAHQHPLGMAAVELGAHELGDLDVVDDDPAHPLVAVDDHLVDHGGDDAQATDVGVADRGPARGRPRGRRRRPGRRAGRWRSRKASVSWWSDRHPGIVAETADGRCV